MAMGRNAEERATRLKVAELFVGRPRGVSIERLMSSLRYLPLPPLRADRGSGDPQPDAVSGLRAAEEHVQDPASLCPRAQRCWSRHSASGDRDLGNTQFSPSSSSFFSFIDTGRKGLRWWRVRRSTTAGSRCRRRRAGSAGRARASSPRGTARRAPAATARVATCKAGRVRQTVPILPKQSVAQASGS